MVRAAMYCLHSRQRYSAPSDAMFESNLPIASFNGDFDRFNAERAQIEKRAGKPC
jgi:hypothetical protein